MLEEYSNYLRGMTSQSELLCDLTMSKGEIQEFSWKMCSYSHCAKSYNVYVSCMDKTEGLA